MDGTGRRRSSPWLNSSLMRDIELWRLVYSPFPFQPSWRSKRSWSRSKIGIQLPLKPGPATANPLAAASPLVPMQSSGVSRPFWYFCGQMFLIFNFATGNQETMIIFWQKIPKRLTLLVGTGYSPQTLLNSFIPLPSSISFPGNKVLWTG